MDNSFNVQNLVRDNVKNLMPYSSARDEFSGDRALDLIFLDANENPHENGVNRYPDPHQGTLKKELANIKKVSEDSILLGNGSDEILDLIFRAFCEPKVDNIITLPPTYGMYKVLANINDVQNREVWLTHDYEPDVDKILDTANDTSKLLFMCTPNNPTGNSFPEAKVERLLEHFKGLVVIDEAYIDFSNHNSWLERLGEFPNLLVTQTLSKAYGMAGIRLGICYASPPIISILKKIKPPYNVNQLTQGKALQRIRDTATVEREIGSIIAGREILLNAIETIGFVEKVYRTDANFVLVKVDDANKRYAQLLEMGIIVRNRSGQPLCENTLRFTVGTQQENERLINVLKDI
ncbi:MAG: histidinol-phosphate transaminase [Flavobacteriaceae bacterium]